MGDEYQPFTSYLSPTARTAAIANTIAERHGNQLNAALLGIINHIRTNIKNVLEKLNHFEHPDETLALGFADCDGQAILAASIAAALPEPLTPTSVALVIGQALVTKQIMLFGMIPYTTQTLEPHAWALVDGYILDTPNGILTTENNPNYIPHTVVTTDDIKIYI